MRRDHPESVRLWSTDASFPNGFLKTVDGYQAANWQRLGESTGRSRNDRQHRLSVPRKAVYLYPLSRRCRAHLCHDT